VKIENRKYYLPIILSYKLANISSKKRAVVKLKTILQQPLQLVAKSIIILELAGGYEILFQDAAPA
jgi:hypothetical protein